MLNSRLTTSLAGVFFSLTIGCLAGDKSIAVVVSESVGDATGKAVAQYLQWNGRVAVNFVADKKVPAGMPAKAADVAKLAGANDVFVIALVNEKAEGIDGVKVMENVAVVNVAVLEKDAGDAAKAKDKIALRINKESCRALGLVAGLKDCPNPTCCLFKQETFADIDKKGGNFCPPCIEDQFGKKVDAKGIRVVPQPHEVAPKK